MGHAMVPVETELKILELHAAGMAQSKIARQLHCARRLVQHIIALGHPRMRTASGGRPPGTPEGPEGRCGICGAKVYLPCRACLLRAEMGVRGYEQEKSS